MPLSVVVRFGQWLEGIIGVQVFKSYAKLTPAIKEADSAMHLKLQLSEEVLKAQF